MEVESLEHGPALELLRLDDTHPSLQFMENLENAGIQSPESRAIVTAQLSGTFLQEQDQQRHIVCYRRNLFHIRGTIILNQESILHLSQSGCDAESLDIYATIDATESTHGQSVAIINVPKTNRESAAVPVGPSPERIIINVKTGLDYATPIAFSWPRLQFRSATHKGGRRKDKGSEQRFTLRIRVFSLASDGSEILLSEKLSNPIVVRGRSPGNYSTIVATTRKATNNPEQQGESRRPVSAVGQISHQRDPPMENDEQELITTDSAHNAADLILQDDQTLFDSETWQFQYGMVDFEYPELLDVDPSEVDETITDPSIFNFNHGNSPVRLPATLSRSSADNTESSEPSTTPASAMLQWASLEPTSADAQLIHYNGPINLATEPQLELAKKPFYYEYIPMRPEDRAPPVQAVYQPHGIHHKTKLPKSMRGNNKRYFGEIKD